ncbi:MAG: cupin domain-containing protein [Polaromonas sp.]|uniref:cupin domain-containing protein n=1 Tax=Polaromonas sp. TaxID=1869339 RepID=UPI002487B46B|nr:cupin domain-containing protein [Polaromonas sp.]MDI1238749.1 cupin domain-containing protein [Polaromonas sp.]
MNVRKPVIAMLAAAALVHPWVFAHDVGAGEEKVSPMQLQNLPDVPGKQVVMAIVSYAPGQASLPHLHAGSVFAYVLEGEVVSQLGGRPPVTYKAGESWYEPPRAAHLVSRNASSTRPARLLAWLVMDEGGKVKEPLPK